MAREVWSFPVVVAVGSTPAAPVITALTIPPRAISEIDIQVPPGPRGEVGFAIGAAGEPIIPLQSGAFIVTDNELVRWPLENQIDSGAWQLFAYNTGQYPHTITVRFFAALTAGQTAGAIFTPLIATDISNPGTLPPLTP
jgi:hypothetical protein